MFTNFPLFPCRVAAQFNQPNSAKPAMARQFHIEYHLRGLADSERWPVHASIEEFDDTLFDFN